MKASVSLFFVMGTQWRWASVGLSGAIKTGMDYGALEPSARLAGVTMTTAVFNDIRAMESAAIEAWSRKHA